MVYRVGTADARVRLCAATERVKSARSSIATAQRHAGDAKARLLARCSHVDAALALPLMAAFTFKPEACDSVRRFSAALSLLMKPLADVLLAPTMAAVTRCGRSGHVCRLGDRLCEQQARLSQPTWHPIFFCKGSNMR